MPTVLSKPQGWSRLNVKNLFLKNRSRKVMSASILVVVAYLIKLRLSKGATENLKINLKRNSKKVLGDVEGIGSR
jgi:hypothetical protein